MSFSPTSPTSLAPSFYTNKDTFFHKPPHTREDALLHSIIQEIITSIKEDESLDSFELEDLEERISEIQSSKISPQNILKEFLIDSDVNQIAIENTNLTSDIINKCFPGGIGEFWKSLIDSADIFTIEKLLDRETISLPKGQQFPLFHIINSTTSSNENGDLIVMSELIFDRLKKSKDYTYVDELLEILIKTASMRPEKKWINLIVNYFDKNFLFTPENTKIILNEALLHQNSYLTSLFIKNRLHHVAQVSALDIISKLTDMTGLPYFIFTLILSEFECTNEPLIPEISLFIRRQDITQFQLLKETGNFSQEEKSTPHFHKTIDFILSIPAKMTEEEKLFLLNKYLYVETEISFKIIDLLEKDVVFSQQYGEFWKTIIASGNTPIIKRLLANKNLPLLRNEYHPLFLTLRSSLLSTSKINVFDTLLSYAEIDIHVIDGLKNISFLEEVYTSFSFEVFSHIFNQKVDFFTTGKYLLKILKITITEEQYHLESSTTRGVCLFKKILNELNTSNTSNHFTLLIEAILDCNDVLAFSYLKKLSLWLKEHDNLNFSDSSLFRTLPPLIVSFDQKCSLKEFYLFILKICVAGEITISSPVIEKIFTRLLQENFNAVNKDWGKIATHTLLQKENLLPLLAVGIEKMKFDPLDLSKRDDIWHNFILTLKKDLLTDDPRTNQIDFLEHSNLKKMVFSPYESGLGGIYGRTEEEQNKKISSDYLPLIQDITHNLVLLCHIPAEDPQNALPENKESRNIELKKIQDNRKNIAAFLLSFDHSENISFMEDRFDHCGTALLEGLTTFHNFLLSLNGQKPVIIANNPLSEPFTYLIQETLESQIPLLRNSDTHIVSYKNFFIQAASRASLFSSDFLPTLDDLLGSDFDAHRKILDNQVQFHQKKLLEALKNSTILEEKIIKIFFHKLSFSEGKSRYGNNKVYSGELHEISNFLSSNNTESLFPFSGIETMMASFSEDFELLEKIPFEALKLDKAVTSATIFYMLTKAHLMQYS